MGNKAGYFGAVVSALAFCLIGVAALFGQVPTLENARRVSDEAVKLARRSDLPAATKVLKEALSRCGDASAPNPARGLLNFTLGYVYEVGRPVSDRQSADLDESVRFYEASLRDLPGNRQAVTNLLLVLKRLGRSIDAIPHLQGAIAKDVENANFYYRELGDIYRSSRELSKALSCYSNAARISPGDDVPYWRMLSVLNEFPTADANTMLGYISWMEQQGKPEFARRGYELIMERGAKSAQAGNDPLNPQSRAILFWANLGAANDWLSQEALSSFAGAKSWPAGAYQGLLRILNPALGSGDLSWWKSSSLGSHVAMNVFRMMAARYLAQDKPGLAMRNYSVALESINIDVDDYENPELINQPVLPLLISVDLARLLNAYPALDPNGSLFRNLETRLFAGKAASYASNNLTAVQYKHTILGLIYAERDRWTSTWQPGNAIYQLEHALEVARRRAAINPRIAQPLPHLERCLVEGYVQTGNTTKALRSSINAAVGYLDLDGLKEAEEMLRLPEKIGSSASPAETAKVKLLQRILKGRKAIALNAGLNFDKSTPEYWRNKTEFSWVSSPSLPDLDTAFVSRQKAKALADIGTAAAMAGYALEAMKDHAEALDALRRTPALLSTYDVVRLESVKNTLIRNLGIPETRDRVVTGYSLDKTTDFKGWVTWSLPARDMNSTHQVALNPEICLASAISGYLTNQANFKPGDLQFTISQGVVTVASVTIDPASDLKNTDLVMKTMEFLKNRKDVNKVSQAAFKEKLKVPIER